MMIEARRAQRRDVHEAITVVDTMTEKTVGRVGNMSESGMLLVVNTALHEDALYQLRFDLIDPVGRATPVEVGAHLLWIGSANTPGQSWAGLRFLTVGDGHLAALRSWIAGAPQLR